MNFKKTSILCVLPVVFLVGCDDSVNPFAPFEPRITVYTLLNTGTSSQVVRVYSSFDPTVDPGGGMAPDTLLGDATITLSDQNTLYALRDTTIFRSDISKYKGDVAAKVATLTPAFGHTYTLKVQSPTKGMVTASTTIPSQAAISTVGLFLISDPLRYNSSTLGINITPHAKGLVFRMLLEYEVYINGIWFPKQDEAPRNFALALDGSTVPIYADLELSGSKLNLVWPLKNQAFAVAGAIIKYNAYHITFKRVIIELRQYEENLYNYYQVVKGFHDPRTIRTDAPDYSNVQGGTGIFGAFTVERIIFDLPPNYSSNK